MKWTDAGIYRGPTRIENGVLVRDDDGATEPVIREDAAGHTHVYLRQPAKVRDSLSVDAPATVMTEIADPRRPASGQQPDESGFKTLDFRRSSDGRWRARDARGRVWRLRVNGDNSIYRVSPQEEDRPWSVRQRQGDKALNGDLTRVHDEARHQPGLTAWASRLSDFWKRKDGPEAA